MNLLKEIREHFATLSNEGVREIISDGVNSWTLIDKDKYGVILPNPMNNEIEEKFNSVSLTNSIMDLQGTLIPVYILSSKMKDNRRLFSTVCAQFLEYGKNNENRDLIQNEPYKWVKKWEDLLGNTVNKKTIYDIIAELLALESMYDSGIDFQWTGPNYGSRDIETDNFSIDVKSSTKKYGTEVTISSQFQLDSDKPLYIYFCRLERSLEGDSINSVVDRMKSKGMEISEIEYSLHNAGYQSKKIERNITYKVLETKKYVVDEGFPSITSDSFVDGKIPDHIIKISYTVNLDSVVSFNWK